MTEFRRNLLAVLVIGASLAAIAITLAAAPPSDADRVAHLSSILKCPICTSESIASSPSDIAREAKTLIEQWVAEGRSDDEILDFFVSTYGADMLLDPPGGSRTVVLWALPAMAALVGLGVIATRRRRGSAAALDAEDRRLVDEALRARERS